MRKVLIGCGTVAVGVPAVLFGVVVYGAIFWNGHIGVETDFYASALLKTPPAKLSGPVDLKVVTFNVQNLWVIGQHRAERMKLIGEYLTTLDPDIAGFQEVFAAPERELLIQSLQGSRLRYSQYYPSGTFGSGVLIMSAWPIQKVFFHRFKSSNKWYHLWEGDWWAGKGVGLARIQHPSGVIDFYAVHAQADYGRARNEKARYGQMDEAADFLLASHVGTAPALFVGDFNCRPGEPEYELVVKKASLQHLMDGMGRIDNIFGMLNPQYSYEVRDFVSWETYKGMELSDHKGYMSTIRITPHP